MKLKYLHTAFAIMLVAIQMSGCKKFVEVESAETEVLTTNVFSSNSTAIAAQCAIYAQMGSLQKVAQFTGLSSDEFSNYSTDPTNVNLYNNTLTDADGNTLGAAFLWSPYYNFIYQANAVLEGLTNSAVDDAVKKQLTGEAKFIRAFWHFYLVNFYGDIPLVTTTDYKVNSAVSRVPATDVYNQIINDLKEAQILLNDEFVGANSVSTSTERVRPTKWAATALLARVYLYSSNWAAAEEESSKVLDNNSLFSLEPELNNVFLKNSNETIWQLMPGFPGFNTDEGRTFILTNGPSSGAEVSLNNILLQSFEPGDRRKELWIGVDSSTGIYYSFPYKYKIKEGSDLLEYSMVLRLAEQFLIRAEARAQQNNFAGAQSDLNTLRTRAGLPEITLSSQPELLQAILHERIVELFTEGHRWFDLRRTGHIDEVMTGVAVDKGSTWNNYQQLYPLPPDDLKTGLNLRQNPGY